MEKVLLCITAASALWAVCSPIQRQYHFIYEPKNWTEARRYCRDTYTDLVTVNSSDVVTVLNKMADVSQMGSLKDAWIGLYFDVISWVWSLSDEDFYHNNANYTNWVPGQPDSIWYDEECALMYINGQWYDNPCQGLYKPICSNVSGTNVTYVLINQLMTWPDSQSYCKEHHTDLASVRDLSEKEKISELIPSGLVWIGLYKNTWKWSNGPMYIYHYWAAAPQGGMRKCAASDFGISGLWRDCGCDVQKAFICHHDPVPFSRYSMKLKLVRGSTPDLNDAAVLDDLLTKLQQKLNEQGVAANIKLSWSKQSNGNIFFKAKK